LKLETGNSKLELMPPVEQFEVLQFVAGHWELVAAFPQLELATEVAKNRSANVRIVRASYENGRKVGEDIILDLGSMRGLA
jgi:hypothetical protein